MNSLFKLEGFLVFTFYYQFSLPPEDAYKITSAGARLDTPSVEKPNPVYIQPFRMNFMV